MKKVMRCFVLIAMTFVLFGCEDASNTPISPTPVIPCSYVFSPSKIMASSLPQTVVVQVVTTNACFWVANTSDSWINPVFQGNKKGVNSVTISLKGNSCTSKTRTGFVKIKGSKNVLEITQDGSDLGICP